MPKPGPSFDRRFFKLWALAGLLEAPAALMLLGFARDWPGALVFVAHAAAAALVFVAPPRGRGYFMRSRHWGQGLAMIAFFLPLLGWAFAGWLMRAHGGAPLDKDAYRFQEEGEDADLALSALGTPEAIERELTEASDVLPAVDALLSGDSALKRGAIEALARLRSPEAIRWIFRARSDRDPEVRFFATSALTRLKRDFESAIHAAQGESEARPGDADLQLAVPRIRREYAASGILDAKARDAVLEDCRAVLVPLSGRSPDALRLLYRVEKLLRPERALALLDRLEHAEPLSGARWLRERAELLFSLRRYPDLKALMKERSKDALPAGPAGLDDADWRAASLWWVNG